MVAGTTDVGLWVTKMHKRFPQVLDVTAARELQRVETYPHHIAIGAAVTLTEAFEALVPGGEMHLIGETLHDDRNGPISAALWGLNEAIQNSTGRAHTESEVKGYLQAAGFVYVTVHPFVPGVLSRITGRKPA